MDKKAALIDNFYHMHKDFRYLHSIHLCRNEEEFYSYNLDIILVDRRMSERKMSIHFSGVVDFKSIKLDSLYVLSISIVDVSADQMEGLHYKVKEDEHELFSFYCDSFSCKMVR